MIININFQFYYNLRCETSASFALISDVTKQSVIPLSVALTLICLGLSSLTEGANILAFLPSSSPSHLVIEMAVVRAMIERNHNITVVSVLPFKLEWLYPEMTHIKLDKGYFEMDKAVSATRTKGLERALKGFQAIMEITYALAEIMDDPKMHELKNNAGNQFELMIFGYIFSDIYLGLANHFNCPVALVWPNVPIIPILELIGNPLELSYTVTSLFNAVAGNNKGFEFRLKNIFGLGIEKLLAAVQHKFTITLYAKHFPADKYASFEKAKERVAMVLFSHHFTEKPVRPLVPGLIEIGGIHLNEEPEPLPKDIEDFVKSAEYGFIFFSLGTNIKVNHLQDGALEKIYNVLSKLPQKVLWKCDDESNVPGNSSNILFRNWLPQGDILGHPNVKLFFGHGGKGGITEAKFYGVPMVGLPIFADQPMNMEEVVSKGYGLSISHAEPLTEEIIYRTVKEVLENETYSNNVKKFSSLYRDRPLKVKDNAVYWLEYLIRYNGAPHLQSPLKTMSFIEATNLDVILFLMLVLFLVVIILRYSIRIVTKFIYRLLRGNIKKD